MELRPDTEQRTRLDQAVSATFCPATPVRPGQIFAGRVNEQADVFAGIDTPGQHAIVFGERGVGKTSLANFIARRRATEMIVAQTACDGSDTYDTIWRKALGEIRFASVEQAIGFGNRAERVHNALELVPDADLDPHLVRKVLGLMGSARPVLVIIDELDRVRDAQVPALMADTIKLLSDQAVAATVVLVGVADTVHQLLGEHESISRALMEVHMPRMSRQELALIVTHGLERLGMSSRPKSVELIAALSQGLPHYTHLLAAGAARSAIARSSGMVDTPDVRRAVEQAVHRAEERIASTYERATGSIRRSIFPEVLLAAALAPTNERGFFDAAAVARPLAHIVGEHTECPDYSRHLAAFTHSRRGPVLHRIGTRGRYRFRFADPLLAPYVVMRSVADGLVDPLLLEGSDLYAA